MWDLYWSSEFSPDQRLFNRLCLFSNFWCTFLPWQNLPDPLWNEESVSNDAIQKWILIVGEPFVSLVLETMWYEDEGKRCSLITDHFASITVDFFFKCLSFYILIVHVRTGTAFSWLVFNCPIGWTAPYYLLCSMAVSFPYVICYGLASVYYFKPLFA